MNIKTVRKKIGLIALCGGMAIGNFAMFPSISNIAFADTQFVSDGELGTITISDFSEDLKSFQIFNYNTETITYNGRTYRTGALIAIIPVNDDGTAIISGLPYGVYRVKEYKTKNGYSSNKSFYTIKITDDTNQNLVPNEPNEVKYGTIRLSGADDISLNGMEFQLKNVGTSIIYNGDILKYGDIVGNYKCQEDVMEIDNLPYGVYELTQTKSTTGNHMDYTVYTINIINEEIVDITIQVTNHIHSWDEGKETIAPTCTKKGTMTYTCSVCNTTRTEEIAVLGHSYYTQEPTCLEDGYRKCTRCNDEYMVLPHTEHDWDEGKLVGTTTCNENAKRIYTCKYCGQEKTVVLPRTNNHSYTSTIVKATDTKEGYIRKVCKKCGKVDTDTQIPKIGNVVLSYTENTYTGQALKPSVKVYDDNGKEISKSYYQINYYNNIKVGTASVKVTFKGNYSGSITEQFTILPKGTSILTATPLYHGFTIKWAMQSQEITGYDIEYATSDDFSDAGILQTTKYTTLAKTVTGLKPDTTYYIRIRTYKGSSYSQWSSVKTVKTKS